MKSSRDNAQTNGNFLYLVSLSASFAALDIFILGNRGKVLCVHSVITFVVCNIGQNLQYARIRFAFLRQKAD